MKRPSPALVVSFVALFVSLGGTSFAVTHYVITSERQIKPNVLRQLVQAKQPSDASVRSLTGPAGPVGAAGPAGSPGAQGAAGKDGTPGTPGLEGKQGERGEAGPEGHIATTLRQATQRSPANEGTGYSTVTARCAVGETALGGGYELLSGEPKVLESRPGNVPPNEWFIVVAPHSGTYEVTVYAICGR
jgi:hypothetical protein